MAVSPSVKSPWGPAIHASIIAIASVVSATGHEIIAGDGDMRDRGEEFKKGEEDEFATNHKDSSKTKHSISQREYLSKSSSSKTRDDSKVTEIATTLDDSMSDSSTSDGLMLELELPENLTQLQDLIVEKEERQRLV
jgi:hypothetical protein